MLGLISYPLLIEQRLTLVQQNRLWTAGYACLALLVAGCAGLLWRSGAASGGGRGDGCTPPCAEQALTRLENDGVGICSMLRWVLYSFIPSSLMLAVTTYLSTDISPFPLLWMVPLAIYLLSFILVFARRPVLPPQWTGRVLSLCAVVLLVALIVAANRPAWVMAVLNLLLLAAAALIYHGQLANERPHTRRLTEFYLCLSIGGVLGGLFNALVAPLLFHNVLEYPLIIVMACLFRPTCEKSGRMRSPAVVKWRDAAWMVGVGAVTPALIFTEQRTGISLGRARTLCLFGLPALVTYRTVRRPVRFGLCLAVLLVVGILYQGEYGRPLTVERSFFGVLRVNVDQEGRFHQMYHGNTLHGRQYIDRQWQNLPLSYFYPTGPAGELFGVLNGTVAGASVGIIGLGTGSLAAYARPDQEWTYYEIDPAVERIARNPAYFTFLQNSRARRLKVVLGDARLRLKGTPDRPYDLFVVDAFSSDSIPMHLVTREALGIYLDKLANHGVLAFHISNRRLDMRPVLASLAGDAGLTAMVNEDTRLTGAEVRDGKEESMWVVMGRKNANLAASYPPPHWQPLLPEPRFAV